MNEDMRGERSKDEPRPFEYTWGELSAKKRVKLLSHNGLTVYAAGLTDPMTGSKASSGSFRPFVKKANM